MSLRASSTVLALCLVAVLASAGGVWGAFSDRATSSGNELRAAPDWVAPQVVASVLQKAEGGTPGFVRPGGSFRVHAATTDAGRPASGVASLTATLNAGVASGTPIVLTSTGTHAVDGVTYDHRSALRAVPAVAPGPLAYGTTAVDVAGNSATRTGFAAVVDGTRPVPTAISTQNGPGGSAGTPEAGDSATFLHSEPVDPSSVVPGWDGRSPTNVVPRLDVKLLGNDTLTVYDATNANVLPLGPVDLGSRGHANQDRAFGTSGAASTLTLSGNGLVLRLGTPSGKTSPGWFGLLRWTPDDGATDRAGNPSTTPAVFGTGLRLAF